MTAASAFRMSALLGFAAVALGAFGAHFLRASLEARAMTDVWKTAVLYHLAHSIVMLALAASARFQRGPWVVFAIGIFLFSGSLYALALGAPNWVGAITPAGGGCLLAGYLMLAWQARSWTAES